MKAFFAEFRSFIQRGSVIDMAVGIMIGAAFKSIVDALVNNIISPLIGSVIMIDFNNLTCIINGVEIAYGSFIMTILNFFILAFVLFTIVKAVNKLRRPAPEAAPTTKKCPFCKTEIDLDATRCPHCTSTLEN